MGERQLEVEAFASVLGERAGFSPAGGVSPAVAALRRQAGALAVFKDFLQGLTDGLPVAAPAYRGGRGGRDSTAEVRLYRTFIAIHEAWLQLWDFLDVRVGEHARATATERGVMGQQRDAIADAAQLTCALQIVRHLPGGLPPYLRAGAPHCRDKDFQSEVAYLLLVAEAWRSPLVAALTADYRADLPQ